MFNRVKVSVFVFIIFSFVFINFSVAESVEFYFKVETDEYKDYESEYYCNNVLKNKRQKDFYRTLVKALSSFNENNIRNKFSLKFEFDKTWGSLFKQEEISNVLNCVFKDHPEFFWFYNITYSQKYNLIKNKSVITLNVNSNSVFDEDIDLKNEIYNLKKNVDGVLAGMPEGDVYNKLKYINSWLCKNNIYNTNYVESPHTRPDMLVSALVKDNTEDNGPRCLGYASAFKFLCDKSDIPCVMIFGRTYKNKGESENHAWNAVRIDNKWYGIDVTWNDVPVGNKFFLVGSETVTIKHFGKIYDEFGENHVPGLIGDNFVEYYPELSKDEFSSDSHPLIRLELINSLVNVDINDGIINIPSEMKAKDVIQLFKHSEKIGILWDGYELSSQEYVGTGSVVYINDENGKMKQDAEIVIKGDLNGDSKITVEDYMLIKKYVSDKYDFERVSFMAGDLNYDNMITSTDYLKLKNLIIKSKVI